MQSPCWVLQRTIVLCLSSARESTTLNFGKHTQADEVDIRQPELSNELGNVLTDTIL